jgi:hypothetical protein
MNERVSSYLSLFGSFGTLICCALPSLLVALGAGATLAGLVSRFPQLVWLSSHSLWIFGAAAFLILIGGFAQFRARSLPCPIDPQQAKSCMSARRLSFSIYLLSTGIFLFALVFSYLIPWIFY